MGKSENICFLGDRRSLGRAGAVISWFAIGDSASSNGRPKIAGWSSTSEDIRGAGRLSVGAKTMPTVNELVIATTHHHKVLTITDVHLVNIRILNDV